MCKALVRERGGDGREERRRKEGRGRKRKEEEGRGRERCAEQGEVTRRQI
jgi:hypothetical protein